MKIKSQISLGIICVILGLMITLQFKRTFDPNSIVSERTVENLSSQVQDLKNQRDDLLKKVQTDEQKISDIEQGFANQSAAAKELKDEVDQLRKLAGVTDVEGKGITITITVPKDVVLDNSYGFDQYYLLDIVNELNSAYAEAISINEERYTSRTQIRMAGPYILINGDSFDPTKPFTIKAIGDPDVLDGALSITGGPVSQLQDMSIDVTITKSNDIKIPAYNKSLDFKYIK